jgi:hypothetical protein
MAKSINPKQGKPDTAVKKKKGRPKKRASKLSSPTKQIEKETRKGRGRPRKDANQRKPSSSILALNESIHAENPMTSLRDWKKDDNEEYVPENLFAAPLGQRGLKGMEEMREKFEVMPDVYDAPHESLVKTRRSQRLMIREETERKEQTIEDRLSNLENMISSIGMMVFALHKKTVNKSKKDMIDDYIRKGFNADTAVHIKESLMRDVNYFDKTRKSSVTINMEGSMLSVQNSVKNLNFSGRQVNVEPKVVKRGRGRPKTRKSKDSLKNQSGKSSTAKGRQEKSGQLDVLKTQSSQIIEESVKKDKIGVNLMASMEGSKAKLTRTESLGGQTIFKLSKPKLNHSSTTYFKKKDEGSMTSLRLEQTTKRDLTQVEEEPQPFKSILKKQSSGRIKRRKLKLDDDEVESEEIDIEKQVVKKKPRALDKIQIEEPGPFTKKSMITPIQNKPVSNVVSIDPHGTPKQQTNFAFNSLITSNDFKPSTQGELSFKNKKRTDPNLNEQFLFNSQKNQQSALSFANLKQTQNEHQLPHTTQKPEETTTPKPSAFSTNPIAHIPKTNPIPSPNQQILQKMRQPIPEKIERENATSKTHQGSENESHQREDSEDDEDFPFEEIGF